MQILSIDSSEVKMKELTSLVSSLLAAKKIEELQALVSSICAGDSLPLNMARGALSQIAKGLRDLDAESCRVLGEHMIKVINPKLSSFEEVEGEVIDELVEIYRDVDRDYEKAAKCLSGKSLNALHNDYDKFKHFIKIAADYLQEDRTDMAETFINRALAVRREFKDQKDNLIWMLRFQTAYAQILDANRKFLEASMR
jgi:hypothetical protein